MKKVLFLESHRFVEALFQKALLATGFQIDRINPEWQHRCHTGNQRTDDFISVLVGLIRKAQPDVVVASGWILRGHKLEISFQQLAARLPEVNFVFMDTIPWPSRPAPANYRFELLGLFTQTSKTTTVVRLRSHIYDLLQQHFIDVVQAAATKSRCPDAPVIDTEAAREEVPYPCEPASTN